MRSESGSVGCCSLALLKMCHLHQWLFLEPRFAKCKGWAGFSRVPDFWEEERGDQGDLLLCANAWRLLLSPVSSGETMLTWLFPSTWGFINPLYAFLLFLSPGPPCFVFSDVPASLLHLRQLVLPWRLLQVPSLSAEASHCAALPVLPAPLLACTSRVSAPGAQDPTCCCPLCRRCELRLCQGEHLGTNSQGGSGKGLEEMGSAAPLFPVAAGLSLSSVLGWKGNRNGLDVSPACSSGALGLDGCSDPVLMGPSGCGKLVLAGEHCFIHVHLRTCLCISSTPFQPASDPGWKAIGLAPYALTPAYCLASLKPFPALFLSSLQLGAEL